MQEWRRREKPPFDPEAARPVLWEFFADDARIELAYLFGSHARGRARASSDVDLAVLLRHEVVLEDRLRAQFALQRAVAKALGRYEVDLVFLNAAPLTLRYQVVRYGQVLFEREPGLRRWYWRRVMNEWFDTRPMRERYLRILLQRIEEVGLGERYFDHREDLAQARRISQEFAQQRRAKPDGV